MSLKYRYNRISIDTHRLAKYLDTSMYRPSPNLHVPSPSPIGLSIIQIKLESDPLMLVIAYLMSGTHFTYR